MGKVHVSYFTGLAFDEVEGKASGGRSTAPIQKSSTIERNPCRSMAHHPPSSDRCRRSLDNKLLRSYAEVLRHSCVFQGCFGLVRVSNKNPVRVFTSGPGFIFFPSGPVQVSFSKCCLVFPITFFVYKVSFWLELSIGSVLELLVLKNSAECTRPRI